MHILCHFPLFFRLKIVIFCDGFENFCFVFTYERLAS